MPLTHDQNRGTFGLRMTDKLMKHICVYKYRIIYLLLPYSCCCSVIAKSTTMFNFRFVKFFFTIFGQLVFVIIFLLYVVHYHLSTRSAVDHRPAASHRDAPQLQCSGGMSRPTNTSNSTSFGHLVPAGTDESVVTFLAKYEAFCQENLKPKASNIFLQPSESGDCLCPCIPSGLGAFMNSRWKLRCCSRKVLLVEYANTGSWIESGALKWKATYASGFSWNAASQDAAFQLKLKLKRKLRKPACVSHAGLRNIVAWYVYNLRDRDSC